MEHITEPRPSCIGLPRQYGPPPTPSHYEEPPPSREHPRKRTRGKGGHRGLCPNKHTGFYGVQPLPTGKYRMQFTKGMQWVNGGVHDTPEAAARAHDAYVRAHGVDRPLNFPDAAESEGVA